ncbi:MAG: ABC transporter permease [Pseudomonadota bacterium]
MILAAFRMMALGLWRDRAALAMTFLLPPLVYLIFAAAFAGTLGEGLRLRLAVADEAGTPASRRLADALLADGGLRAQRAAPATGEAVRRAVRAGRADAGVILRAGKADSGEAAIVVSDASRAIAAPLVAESVRRAMAAGGGILLEDVSSGRGAAAATYYAGAVSLLFALISAASGALSLIEERRSGVADRILAGARGLGPVVTGKFLFLAAQGVLQAVVVFAAAQLAFGVPVLQHVGPWLATTALASVSAAGVALGLVAFCRTLDQARLTAIFVVLALAAVGGGLAPRFLMPPWLQALGWATPHAWAIEAYQTILWRDGGPLAPLAAWTVMAAIGLAGLALAQLATRVAR